MKLRSAELVIVGVAIAFVILLPFFASPAQAAEPTLEEILNNLGFTNIAETTVKTFSADSYEIILYAEFAGYADQNELSYYEVGTSNFIVIFSGPEGGFDYLNPPLAKYFTADYQFGLSFRSRTFRYFTETSRNGDGLQHAKIYENLDDPDMFLVGFENQWGGGDKDYNDMVFSLKPLKQPPVASFNYSPLYPVLNETVTFNASDSSDSDGSIVSYQWDFGDGNITTVNNPIVTHIYTVANSTFNYTVSLTVTDNDGLTSSITTTVSVTNPSILHVSLPSGEDRTGLSDSDPWLDECWFLNITDASGAFTIKIEDVSFCVSSYDTHLVIALNDAAYNNLATLTVNSVTLVKNDFKHGTLRPYNLKNWPSGDVYPTWFNDTLVNVGTIPPKGHVNVTVSVTFTNATGVKMHFDAYGSKKSSPIPPTEKSYITYNPLSKDSTVLFSPPPEVNYYLTVISPYDTPSGDGWYVNGTTAYATLNTGVIDHGNGTRRVFTHWSGDASGTDYAQSDPITMDQPKTAVASWKTQYYLTLTTDPSSVTTPSGEGWYDTGAYASISTNALVDIVPGSSRYNFSGWTTADMPEITNPASPTTTVLMDKPKTVTANYKTQYLITFDQSGVGVDFTGNVVSIDGSNYGVGDLSISFWWDSGTDHSFSFASPLVVDVSKQYVWTSTSGLSTSQSDTLTVTNSGSVTGHYSTGTKYQITFDQVGVGSDFTDTIVIVDGTPYSRSSLPVSFWWDVGTTHSFSFLSPLIVTSDTKQYVWESTTGLSTLQTDSITVTMSGSVTGNYKTQFYLTVTSPYDSPTPTSGWFDDGTSIVASITSPVSGSPNTQYVCTGWTGTGSVPESGITTSATFTINEPSIITWNWKTQYYLTVTSPYGTPGGEGWYDGGSTAYATLYTGAVDQGNGTRRIFTSWTGDASGTDHAQSNQITMDGPKTATASWKTQYYLTLTTTSGGITNPSSSGWHDVGTIVSVTAIPDTYYLFDHWELDSINIGSANPYDVTVDTAHTLHAVFVHEMSTLTVTATPGGTTNLPPGSYVYPAGTSVVVTALPSPNYVLDHWEFDGIDVGSANPYTVFLNPDHTLNAVFLYSPPSPPSSPVVGGSTVSIKSPLLPTWISLNVVLIATIFITASWMKRRKK